MEINKRLTTKELLKIIGIGALIVVSLAMPGLPKVYFLLKGKNKKPLYFDKKNLSSQIWRLKNKELINISEERGDTIIRLTEKGKEKVLRYNFEELELERPEKWDRRWRMVIFDIPEKYKVAREIFREKIKMLGFYRLQDSVFIYPFPCEKEIEFMREYLGIGNYVLFLTFRELERSELSLTRFNF
ncbi:MAG: hypothetical protein HYZ02_03120 [Candidatus Levybacteria bacterium]|nr:hypothetical protein [Candidatus Levybacteria bacterium]